MSQELIEPPAIRSAEAENVMSAGQRRVVRLTSADWLIVAFGIALTYAICFRLGAGRLFWEDEVLGWLLLKDPSWRHVLFSWQHGADGGGALFYILGRIWFKMFGSSVASFRLFTATCFATAFALLWKAARQYYPVTCVAFAVCVTWFLSPALVPHIAEGRFYGLFLAAFAATLLVILRSFRTPPNRWLAFIVFVANSALVTSHILGIAYSATMVAAWCIADRRERQFRPRLYLSAAASWLWLIPSYPAIAASAAVGKPHFWTTQPNLQLFLLAYTGSSLRTTLILCTLASCLALQVWLLRRGSSFVEGVQSRAPILILMGALFCIPIIFLMEGFTGPPLFNERYLQPVEAGIIILAAELALRLEFGWRLLRRYRSIPLAAAFAALLAMVLHYDLIYLPHYIDQQDDYSGALTATLPAGVPILCEDAFTFTELMPVKAGSLVRYMYLLDWPNSISDKAPRLEVTQFHLMENWKTVGYFSDHIEYREAFLEAHPYFLVLHTDQNNPASVSRKASSSMRAKLIGNPLASRFSNDPTYHVLPYSAADYGKLRETVTLVCRRDLDCNSVKKELKSSSVARGAS